MQASPTRLTGVAKIPMRTSVGAPARHWRPPSGFTWETHFDVVRARLDFDLTDGTARSVESAAAFAAKMHADSDINAKEQAVLILA